MEIIPDKRILRISMINCVSGRQLVSQAADFWQDSGGSVITSGLWSDMVPLSQEDNLLMARELGISPLEFLYRRISSCPMIKVEIFQ